MFWMLHSTRDEKSCPIVCVFSYLTCQHGKHAGGGGMHAAVVVKTTICGAEHTFQ
jgi:hypothetical protein